MIRRWILCALTIAAASSAAAQPIPLVFVNGDFESGVDPGATYTRLAAGAADITGWAVLPVSVDYIGGYWDAASGTRFVDLDGNFGEAGGVAQWVATTPGQQYQIHFSFAGLPVPGGPDIKSMQVRAGATASDYEFSVVGHAAQYMGWVEETFTFTAASSMTLIEFVSTTAQPGNGPVIDNVRGELAVTTEASTWGRIKAMFAP